MTYFRKAAEEFIHDQSYPKHVSVELIEAAMLKAANITIDDIVKTAAQNKLVMEGGKPIEVPV